MSTMTPPSIPEFSSMAEAAMKILIGDEALAGITLLAPLVQQGLVSFDAPVRRAPTNSSQQFRSGGQDVPAAQILPLRAAVLASLDARRYLPYFYCQDAAEGLVSLDPTFFHQTVPEDLWFWRHLSNWAGDPERVRLGFGSKREGEGSDGWAAAVIEQLPDSDFDRPDATAGWRALLKMGFVSATRAFAKRKPSQWLVVQNNRSPLRDAKGDWILDVVFDPQCGADPWTVLPDGRPLWRHLAPKTPPVTLPEKGDLTAGLEEWVSKALKTETPEHRCVLEEYLVGVGIARMNHVNWHRNPCAERLAYLKTLPSTWVHGKTPWPQNGESLPQWARPFFTVPPAAQSSLSKKTAFEHKEWARQLALHGPWNRAIGPLAWFAIWLVQKAGASTGLAEAIEASANAEEGARHPDAAALLKGLVKSWGDRPGGPAMEASGTALMLHASLPKNDTAGSSRHRARL